MTTFLHTADVHLSPDHPERWEALRAVVRVASREDVDALIVAGDLLDRGSDSARLRPDVRGLFAELEAPVVLIPGNHDLDAYRAGQDWGPRTRVLRDEPLQITEVAGIRVVGVPFPAEDMTFGRLRPEVRRALAGDPGVLVLHGTLIEEGDPRIQSEAGEDEPGRYLPVHLETLADLDTPYVALGHYHQHATRELRGRTVAYAGSPAPVGGHALGPRSAVLVSLEATGGPGDGPAIRQVRPVELDVPYRQRLQRWLPPFDEARELDALEEELAADADPRCRLEVRVEGILAALDEEQLRARTDAIVESVASGYADLTFDLAGVGLSEELVTLFRDFSQRLERRDRSEPGPGRETGDPLTEDDRHRALEIAARALQNAGG